MLITKEQYNYIKQSFPDLSCMRSKSDRYIIVPIEEYNKLITVVKYSYILYTETPDDIRYYDSIVYNNSKGILCYNTVPDRNHAFKFTCEDAVNKTIQTIKTTFDVTFNKEIYLGENNV